MMKDIAKMGTPFIIAVIGHVGVGKTTVIHRATKLWGVSEPITTTLPSGQSSELNAIPSSRQKLMR